jgi:5-methylcytosine-specific restriction endonuclease McrA
VEGPVEIEEENLQVSTSPGRLIPTEVKLAVLKRDKMRCVQCGATNNLHFDHILPWSKGGSSTKVENIQLLCQRHNLEKSAKIV